MSAPSARAATPAAADTEHAADTAAAAQGYAPISSYGVIGDLHTVALVGLDGSIDFMCYPEFHSPTIFAALLDRNRGGCFKLAPLAEAAHKQLYLPDTNILLTRFLSREGVAETSDFMPITDNGHAHDVIRRVKTVRGEMRYRMSCAPRFDYARAGHRVEARDHEVLFRSEGPDGTVLRLRSSVPLRVENGDAFAEFTLRGGEHASFVLEDATAERESSAAQDYVSEAFKQTADFWRLWMRRCTYEGRWREIVRRSALALKLLISRPHGSIVAAPTFGLPEEVGGERNWDYRYTWIRDASFTLYALTRLGYADETGPFMDWIEARCSELEPDGALQIMYGIDGAHSLEEHTLDHLEGYRGSRPVRIGNAAYRQRQLDIYGALLDAVYLSDAHHEQVSEDLWRNLVRMLEWVCRNWSLPDHGIWEVRSEPREFLISRVMCWVALDRAIRLAIKRSLPAPLERWRSMRDAIRETIFEGFWDPAREAFVQYRGGTSLDAAALLMPLMRFIGPTDRRWLSTLKAIEHELVEDSLVHRYRLGPETPDGLQGHEGTFSMCSFWYVECLARAGDELQARLYFEKMLGYASPLGLYSEELGYEGEHLGNYPQALTHLALISAAYELDRRLTARRAGA